MMNFRYTTESDGPFHFHFKGNQLQSDSKLGLWFIYVPRSRVLRLLLSLRGWMFGDYVFFVSGDATSWRSITRVTWFGFKRANRAIKLTWWGSNPVIQRHGHCREPSNLKWVFLGCLNLRTGRRILFTNDFRPEPANWRLNRGDEHRNFVTRYLWDYINDKNRESAKRHQEWLDKLAERQEKYRQESERLIKEVPCPTHLSTPILSAEDLKCEISEHSPSGEPPPYPQAPIESEPE